MHRNTRIRPPRLLILAWTLICSLLFVSHAVSEEIRVSAAVDRNDVTLEDLLQLSVSVHGVQNAPAPALPAMPDFRVQPTGTSASTQVINGVMSVSKTYNYQLMPMQTGTLTIGRAVLELAGKTYTSEPIVVKVREPTAPSLTDNSPVYVEATVSNDKPYLHEQFVYTFKLYRRVNVKNLKLDMPHDRVTFNKEDLGDTRRYARIVNGVQYQIHELSVALFPTRTGRVEIQPTILELDYFEPGRRSSRRTPFGGIFDDPFFNRGVPSRHKALRTNAITVEIQPLPMPGRPANFADLVGRFSIDASLGKTEVEVGDTTTLTLVVSGTGNVREVLLSPEIMKDQFKIYPDQPEWKQSVRGNRIAGEKIFKFALVPLQAGMVTLPSVTLPYFDPESHRYVTIQTPPLTLSVLPSSTAEKLNVAESAALKEPAGQNSIAVLGRDILPIHTRLSDFENKSSSQWQDLWVVAELIFPATMFLAISGVVRYRRRLKTDPAFYRSRTAYKIARQKLDALMSHPGDSKEFVKQLSLILREYVGNKLNLPGKAFTSSEVEARMKERHYSEEQAVSTRCLLEKYETLQYIPAGEKSHDGLLHEAQEHLQQLEKNA